MKLLEGRKILDLREESKYYYNFLELVGVMHKINNEQISNLQNEFELYEKGIALNKLSDKEKKFVERLKKKRKAKPKSFLIKKNSNQEMPKLYQIPNENKYFAGRFVELEKIKKILRKKNIVGIKENSSNLGRIGKTEIAIKYVKESIKSRKYNQIFWIDCSKKKKVKKQMKQLANYLGMPSEKHKEKNQLKNFKRWLNQNKGWLIVFDEVKHKQDIEEYLGIQGGKILITTRDRLGEFEVIKEQTVKIDVLKRAESVELLSGILDVKRNDEKKTLQELEHLSLYLGDYPKSLYRAGMEIKGNPELKIKNYQKYKENELEKNGKHLKKNKSNVPKRNKNFTEREVELSLIEEKLEKSPFGIVSLAAETGIGGIGKTQMALQYTYRNAHKYKKVWWINAESDSTIYTSFLDFARRGKISISEEDKKQRREMQVIKRWLVDVKNRGWMLAFDNAKKQDVVKKYIPQKGGHILITSKNKEWETVTDEVIEVGIFKPEEALEYIIKMTKIKKEEEDINLANELSKELEYLPLGLAQACSYIVNTEISFREYIDIFKKKRKELMTKYELPPKDYEEVVHTTWDITMERIDREESGLIEKQDFARLALQEDEDNFEVEDLWEELKQQGYIQELTKDIAVIEDKFKILRNKNEELNLPEKCKIKRGKIYKLMKT
ncbi:atp/gtp-binding protein-related [Anaeramoeba flamelloides]|uniref:Atp/gtp-binding protein-related n=1 Tax=Anaeramoeba flamelloides TaxID=1746091 RepID=A0AAV7ZRG8_9EUKA|nr:atp/gtp-binding protein-related [Anaeramoeba flamelloides]